MSGIALPNFIEVAVATFHRVVSNTASVLVAANATVATDPLAIQADGGQALEFLLVIRVVVHRQLMSLDEVLSRCQATIGMSVKRANKGPSTKH